MKIKIFHWENFIFFAGIISMISIIFDIKINNIIQLDMIFVMLLIWIGLFIKPRRNLKVSRTEGDSK